jgi:hypothetical protein
LSAHLYPSKHTETANGESTFYTIHDTVHRGDIIGVVGHPSMLCVWPCAVCLMLCSALQDG